MSKATTCYSLPREARHEFEHRYEPEPNTGCWLWTGAMLTVGYGTFRYKKRITGAHRASWMLHNGPINDGLYVLHKCDVRSCVNPDHLFLGTHHDNILDAQRKGRLLKKVCKRGHTFSGDNVYIRKMPDGGIIRSCRKCNNRRVVEWRKLHGRKKEPAHK